MILAIVVLLLILSALITFHEMGHFIVAKLSKVRVEEFGLGMFVKLLSFKKGETEYSLNAIPIGGFVRLTGEDQTVAGDSRSFSEKSHFTQICILIAGVVFNLLFGFILLSFVFAVGLPNWANQVKIIAISSNSPAQKAGLKAGDIILKADTTSIETAQDLEAYSTKHLDQAIQLSIKRDSTTLNADVLLRKNPPQGQGPMGIQTQTDVFVSSYEQYAPFDAIKKGFSTTLENAGLIVQGIYGLFRDLIVSRQAPSDVAGPVGIGQIIFQLLKFGYRPVLQFVALLSINLAVINLIPIPALDGGRVLFAVIETVSRKKIPSKVSLWVNAAGMAVLLLLMAVITFHDIIRIVAP